MIALRLFSLTDASRQIDVRVLGAREEITLGRDAGADWPLADPDRALSRLHLKVGVRDGVVSVTDISTNGVTSATREERLPRDKPVRVEPGERLELGPYALLIERSDHVVAPEPIASRDPANPFAPVVEGDEPHEARRRVDPFASGMAPDPLSNDPVPGESLDGGLGLGSIGHAFARPGASAGLQDGDVWNRRAEPHAGGWDASPSRAEPMIGASRAWTEPAAEAVGERGFGFDAPFRQPILRTPDVAASDLAIPSDWDSAPAPRPEPAPAVSSPFDAPATKREPLKPSRDQTAPAESHPATAPVKPPTQPAPAPAGIAPPESIAPSAAASAGLFEAFCAGAKLDPSSLAGEDPAAMMQRLGAVYRHMVLGLSDVLGERTALKNEYRMMRTTIQADENNPFKWAPPQKVATELLRSASDGFLDGPTAVAESYQDIKKHLLCMLAGLRAALSSSLDALAPERIEEAIKDQSFVLKPRASVAWAEYVKAYGQFRREAEDNADSPVNREFRAAYEKQLEELDRMALR